MSRLTDEAMAHDGLENQKSKLIKMQIEMIKRETYLLELTIFELEKSLQCTSEDKAELHSRSVSDFSKRFK